MDENGRYVYLMSFIMLVILVGLIGYLTFIPVPDENKELVITVLGVILGGGAAAMPNLFSTNDAETEKLRIRIRYLEEQLTVVTEKYNDLNNRYELIVEMLINRHFIPSDPRIPPTLPNDMKKFTKE